MIINSETMLYVTYLVSDGLLIAALIITLIFSYPLQVKQSKVPNGLGVMRKQLLSRQYLIMSVIFLALAGLNINLLLRGVVGMEVLRYLTIFVVFVFSLFIFINQTIEAMMYRRNYSLAQIMLHKRFEVMEKKEAVQDSNRETARLKKNKDARDATKRKNSHEKRNA